MNCDEWWWLMMTVMIIHDHNNDDDDDVHDGCFFRLQIIWFEKCKRTPPCIIIPRKKPVRCSSAETNRFEGLFVHLTKNTSKTSYKRWKGKKGVCGIRPKFGLHSELQHYSSTIILSSQSASSSFLHRYFRMNPEVAGWILCPAVMVEVKKWSVFGR